MGGVSPVFPGSLDPGIRSLRKLIKLPKESVFIEYLLHVSHARTPDVASTRQIVFLKKGQRALTEAKYQDAWLVNGEPTCQLSLSDCKTMRAF